MPTFTTRTPTAVCALNCVGTVEDLARQGVALRDGMPLTFYSDDLDAKGRLDELLVDGVVSFSDEEHCWVAAIDWSAIHHASEGQTAPEDRTRRSSETSAGGNGRTHPVPGSDCVAPPR